MSFYTRKNPILNAIVGFAGMRAMLRGSLFGALVETGRAQDYLDQRPERRKAQCTEVARDAAIADAKQTGGDVEHAKAAAIAAGKECMGMGPHVADIAAQPNGFIAGVVFTLSAVIAGALAFSWVAHHG